MSLYDTVRANVDESGGEERVEVNQRALIDKILARYASAGAVYRELLQNSNDAEATTAEIHFTTEETTTSTSSVRKPIVKSVQYRNNGMPFRQQDWARLKKIAEGNPDESKIGAFGVGAYTMFSICEEPLVLSGKQALAFVWKGDALWTKTVNNSGQNEEGWTSFILPSRDPYTLPSLKDFGEFLCASLTFTKSLREIRVYVDGKQRITITKTQLHEPSAVQIQKNTNWWKSDGAVTASPNGLFSLRDASSLLESFYHIQVTLDGETAAVMARFMSAVAKTKIPANMTKRMERVTKKKPPSTVEVQILLNGQSQLEDAGSKRRNKAHQILQSFSPRIGEGRIFIGFRTSQTTGLAAHLAAPFVPTVEREAMDLQDPTLRTFNTDLLDFSGILMRLTLEHGMTALSTDFAKGAAEREKLEEELLQQPEPAVSEDDTSTADSADSTEPDNKRSGMWGFAKFMAKGVKNTIVKVVNQVEELVDDGGELMHPRDPRPLCPEENQAIILMQSFCPRQSTPDPSVGTALAQGFSRCLPDKSPPVLTRSGVLPADQARLPNKGMEAFCRDHVVRSVVYKNTEEYHDVIAQCPTLNLDDLSDKLGTEVLDREKIVRLLKWWGRYSKVYPHISVSRGVDLKERVQFRMEYQEKGAATPVFKLKDFLFYLDKDKIRTASGYALDALPMPDSILPKAIQDEVTVRILTEPSLENWFSPLPVEIWAEFISHHHCMTSGQPEDENLRLQVLSTLSQEFSRRSPAEQSVFGGFCQSILKERRCVPFDSTTPTSYSADIPSNLYLYTAELEAFDGIGSFHKVSERLKHLGVSDDFLVALGVRKSVAVDFLFANLDTLQWSSDPKPLVEYLRTASLTAKDIQKLRSTAYLPCESDIDRMFPPNELYLPDRDLRIFPFLQLLQWPSEDALSESSQNGKFLVGLGVNVLPSLLQVLRYASDLEDEKMRVRCLEFVCKRMVSRGPYQAEFLRMGKTQKLDLKFMPCLLKSPLEGETKIVLHSVLTCCSEERCAVMGFPVIDPSLGDRGKLFGNHFQCVKEPDAGTVLQQLLLLVSSAKRSLESTPRNERNIVSQQIVLAFSEIFQYLSTRTQEMGPTTMGNLGNQDFIPCLVGNEVQWFKPSSVFFKSENDGGDSITESLFQSVDFSPFLAAAGVRQEASTKDIFRLMIQNPEDVMAALKTEEKYRMFLRRVAAHRPFQRVTAEIRDSPFLLAYSVKGDDAGEKTSYELAKAKDIYIIDNSFFARMFPVKRAPHESDLEEFYALVGSKYISKEVDKKYDVIGRVRTDTSLTNALLDRIRERSPLLVSPSVTSRPLVTNASSILNPTNFDIYEAEELKAVYSLAKSVRSQKTTCCSQPGRLKKNSLYLTSDFDWFDVGYAIGELILKRCQLEDAFFISSLLEAPLEQLRARGFPVDRIIKLEEVAPEPETARSAAPNDELPPVHSSNGASRSASQATAPQKNPGASPTIANIPPTTASASSSQQSHSATASQASDPKVSLDNVVTIIKQMYPDADETYIRQTLGDKPTVEKARALAEEMAVSGYPKAPSEDAKDVTDQKAEPTKPTASSEKDDSWKPGKLLGSRRLGRALNGLRSSGAGPAPGWQNQGTAAPPSGGAMDKHAKVEPETDATLHSNMEEMLENTVRRSATVNPDGIQSPDKNIVVPEGLDKGATCEALPGQDLKPFLGRNPEGEAHNGIKIFSARKHPSSEEFLSRNDDVIESFAVVLERLCRVYELALSSVAIFHDPTGGTIAFNAGRALHFNARFFYAIHYSHNLHQNPRCYSYWFVTFAHELAHHMASGHNKEHGFYTESYVSLYLPKLVVLLSSLE